MRVVRWGREEGEVVGETRRHGRRAVRSTDIPRKWEDEGGEVVVVMGMLYSFRREADCEGLRWGERICCWGTVELWSLILGRGGDVEMWWYERRCCAWAADFS